MGLTKKTGQTNDNDTKAVDYERQNNATIATRTAISFSIEDGVN